MKRRILWSIPLLAAVLLVMLPNVPDRLSMKVEGRTIIVENGSIYEMNVSVPSEPVIDYARKSLLQETLITENVEGIFTYTYTLRNWLNQTAVFTLRQHVRLNEALIITDMQIGYADFPQFTSVVTRVNRLIEQAREANIPVIFLRTLTLRSDMNSTDWNLQPGIRSDPADYLVSHGIANAFTDTDLDRILRNEDIQQIYFTGADSFGTLRKTADAALSMNYHVVIVSDAHTDYTGTPDITVDLVNDLYKNRERCKVILTEAVAFH